MARSIREDAHEAGLTLLARYRGWLPDHRADEFRREARRLGAIWIARSVVDEYADEPPWKAREFLKRHRGLVARQILPRPDVSHAWWAITTDPPDIGVRSRGLP